MERLKEVRVNSGATQQEIARALKIDRTTYNKYENGASNPTPETLSRIADYFHVTVDYLLGRSDDPAPNDLLRIPGIQPIHRKSFPLLGEIACGEPTWREEEHETMIESTDSIDADFCLRAVGDSMTGSQIDDGDIVFIKQMPMVDNGDIAAVLIENETTLKRVDYNPDTGILILWPDNSAYRPMIFQGEELNRVRILGRAVMIQKIIRRK